MSGIIQFVKKYHKECVVGLILILCLAIFPFGYSFAANSEAVESVYFDSIVRSYEDNEEGAYRLTATGAWITENQVKATVNVDAIPMEHVENTDVIFVLDTSSSMTGDRLSALQNSMNHVLNTFFTNTNNRAALITFNSEATILSQFTNDKSQLLNQVNNITPSGNTSYYQALLSVENILQNYTKEEDKELMVLFLTDGFPDLDLPNEKAIYTQLKSTYPYLTIRGIQYDMGNGITDSIKSVSDEQYIANPDNLEEIMLEATRCFASYDSFELTYDVNGTFKVNSVDDITVDYGSVTLEDVFVYDYQRITWNLDGLNSGDSVTLTITMNLNGGNWGDSFSPYGSIQAFSEIQGMKDMAEADDYPILYYSYGVTYDGNAPEGCSVSNIPSGGDRPFKVIEISDQEPICEGYEFKGWKIVTEGVTQLNDDYFIMPGKDVVLRAEWSKITVDKAMDGELYTVPNLYKYMRQDAVMDNTSSEYVSSSTGINFGAISSDTNGKGVYIRAGTENNEHPILYYRGNVDNNHVKFGGYCWRIVRTTEKGGTKLLYDGTPNASGYCQNTGNSTVIGSSMFNQTYNSLADVGYMYGTRHNASLRNMSSGGTSAWVYGNDVSWNGSSYTLLNTATSSPSNWSSDRLNIIGKGHRYTCLSGSSSCSTVYYVHSTFNATYMYYTTLTGGRKIDDILNETLTSSSNTSNSTVKTTIDNWYSGHLNSYTNYLEDAVWCNDRSITYKSGFDKDYEGTGFLFFAPTYRISNPILTCPNSNDAFTVNSANGNGKLTYPIGMVTIDEVVLAGGIIDYTNTNYYMYNGIAWWLLSAYSFNNSVAFSAGLNTNGAIAGISMGASNIRPSITLRGDLLVSKGNGTSTSPYELVLE